MKLILSLHPFATVGGGELFSANAWKAMALHDPDWRLAVPLCATPGALIDSTPMLCHRTDAAGRMQRTVKCFGRVLQEEVATAEHLWIHQFAASLRFHDVCWSALDAEIWVTSLGCDPLLDSIAKTAAMFPQLCALEISGYAAARMRARGLPADPLTAGVWEREIQEPSPKRHGFVAIGRVLPHKGFDVTIRALPRGSELTVVGDPALNEAYAAHLRDCARGRRVHFAGGLPEPEKTALLRSAKFLVASSTHRPWDGTRPDQVELLGLVVLEAVAAGTLPICSDVPSFREIMSLLGLAELVCPEGDGAALEGLMRKAREMSDSDYLRLLDGARQTLRKEYLWDSFASRFDALTKSRRPVK